MRPLLFEIPIPFLDFKIPIFAYGLMLMFGFLTGTKLAEWIFKTKGQKTNMMGDFMFVALVCGILGSRALAVWENWDELHNKPLEWFEVWKGGLTYYGGLIFGVAGCLIYLKRKRQDLLWFADMVTPSLALGLAWGRLGCLLNGCCYGAPTDSIFGVVFPDHCQVYTQPGVPAGTPVYPAQVYSIFFALGLMVLVLVLDRIWKTRKKGQLITLAGIIYALFRFGIEMIRSDNSTDFLWGITISQAISLGFGALSAAAFVWFATFGELAADGPHTPLPRADDDDQAKTAGPKAAEPKPGPSAEPKAEAAGGGRKKRRRRK